MASLASDHVLHDSGTKNAARSSKKENAELQEVVRLANTDMPEGKNFLRAEIIIKGMLRADPRSAYAYAGLAEIYYILQQKGSPISTTTVRALADKAISLDPNLPDPYVVIAKLSLYENRVYEAQRAADIAIRLAPNKPEAMFAKARVAETLGDWASAKSWFEKAIAAHKELARKGNIYSWLGDMYLEESPPDVGAAGRAYRKAVELNPGDAPIQDRYASFLLNHTRHYDAAARHAERAMNISGFDAARKDLGIALYAKWAEAFVDHRKVRVGSRSILDPKTIQTHTGVSPQFAFANAAVRKHLGIITEALLKSGIVQNVDIVTEGNCCTAFVAAAYADNFVLAKLLLHHGANINAVDNANGYTALMYFVKNNDVRAVDYLLSRGAGVNVVDARGVPLIQHALTDGQSYGAEIVNQLLAHGADPTLTDANGWNLLFVAAQRDQAALVTRLVEQYKMNVNLVGSDGWTPLVAAAVTAGPHKKTVAALLKAGADPWVKYGNWDILTSIDALHNRLFPDSKDIAAMIVAARKHYPEPKGFSVPPAHPLPLSSADVLIPNAQ